MGVTRMSLYYSVGRPNRCTHKLVWSVPQTLILGNLGKSAFGFSLGDSDYGRRFSKKK